RNLLRQGRGGWILLIPGRPGSADRRPDHWRREYVAGSRGCGPIPQQPGQFLDLELLGDIYHYYVNERNPTPQRAPGDDGFVSIPDPKPDCNRALSARMHAYMAYRNKEAAFERWQASSDAYSTNLKTWRWHRPSGLRRSTGACRWTSSTRPTCTAVRTPRDVRPSATPSCQG